MSDVKLRPLRHGDPATLSAAFGAIGWNKPASQYEAYLLEQRAGLRWIRVAVLEEGPVGYVTLVWAPDDPVFRNDEVPEVMDLNVLPPFRNRGIGGALLDVAEAQAATRSPTVGLRVGLHAGYGAAQRLYVRRGYLPDGCGAVIQGRVVPEGASINLNDDVTLRMTKTLTPPAD